MLREQDPALLPFLAGPNHSPRLSRVPVPGLERDVTQPRLAAGVSGQD